MLLEELTKLIERASKILNKNLSKIDDQENMKLINISRSIGAIGAKATYEKELLEVSIKKTNHIAVKKLKGKINPGTGKSYTEKEIEAEAFEAYSNIYDILLLQGYIANSCKSEVQSILAAIVNIRQYHKPKYNLSDNELNILAEIT